MRESSPTTIRATAMINSISSMTKPAEVLSWMKKEIPAAMKVQLATQVRVAVAIINMYGNIIMVIIQGTILASGDMTHMLPARPIGIHGVLRAWTAGRYARRSVTHSVVCKLIYVPISPNIDSRNGPRIRLSSISRATRMASRTSATSIKEVF